VEGSRCTFLYRGEADGVYLIHRVVGLPGRLPLRLIPGTDLWYLVLELPDSSRVEYQFEVSRDGRVERGNDPLNPHHSHSPMGSSSVCFARGYVTPSWTEFDPEARAGTLVDMVVPSRALRRETRVRVYVPARFRRTARYPLLVVHDGSDFLQFASFSTVLDNLIHRLDMAETVVAFIDPGDRLVEYANSAAHARWVSHELIPALESEFPVGGTPAARCLLGASFGGVASLSTAYRNPGLIGSLVLLSGSFVFTDIGTDHQGGPVFDPVVAFMNAYRARPRPVAERIWQSCGVYEPLIVPNRSMVPVFEGTGTTVRYVEARDGHSWENWRDRLGDALGWIYPGPQKFVYE
jgi:enterochelin esterase family protein